SAAATPASGLIAVCGGGRSLPAAPPPALQPSAASVAIVSARAARAIAGTLPHRTGPPLLRLLLLLAGQDVHQLADDAEHDLVGAAADRHEPRVAVRARRDVV